MPVAELSILLTKPEFMEELKVESATFGEDKYDIAPKTWRSLHKKFFTSKDGQANKYMAETILQARVKKAFERAQEYVNKHAEIVKLYNDGVRSDIIAESVGKTRATVWRILMIIRKMKPQLLYKKETLYRRMVREAYSNLTLP